MLGFETPAMSTGSTEPAALFKLSLEALGIRGESDGTKPEMARKIVESAGSAWVPDYESRGSTVTKAGLEAVRDAVSFFVGRSNS